MSWLKKLTLRLRALFRKGRVEQELDEELRFHLDRQIQENLAAGMSVDYPAGELTFALRGISPDPEK